MESPLPSGLLADVHPRWLEMFGEPATGGGPTLMELLVDAYRRIVGRGEEIPHTPPPSLVLEAFRYFPPEETNFVVVGQDPYPTAGDAVGLSFSIPPGTSLPATLRVIMSCLARGGDAKKKHPVCFPGPCRQHGCPECVAATAPGVPLCAEHGHSKQVRGSVCDSPAVLSGDLHHWAIQGGLLLNRSLTTRAGARNAHSGDWDSFTSGVVVALARRAAARGRRLAFLLWGRPARALDPSIEEAAPGAHLILHWTHPSPAGDNRLPPPSRFVNCPHFGEVNALLKGRGSPEISWDPLAYTLFFTDGGCVDNGGPAARASYAVYFMCGPLARSRIRGLVPPHPLRLRDPGDVAAGFEPDPARRVAPSNNRGEYLAWCWALLAVLRGSSAGHVEGVTDCNLIVQTVYKWLPARRAAGTVHKLKNLDLVAIIDSLSEAVRARALGLKFTHTNSHRPCPPPDAPRRERVVWYGNDLADRDASATLTASADRGSAAAPDGAGAAGEYRPIITCDGSARAWAILPPADR